MATTVDPEPYISVPTHDLEGEPRFSDEILFTIVDAGRHEVIYVDLEEHEATWILLRTERGTLLTVGRGEYPPWLDAACRRAGLGSIRSV